MTFKDAFIILCIFVVGVTALIPLINNFNEKAAACEAKQGFFVKSNRGWVCIKHD